MEVTKRLLAVFGRRRSPAEFRTAVAAHVAAGPDLARQLEQAVTAGQAPPPAAFRSLSALRDSLLRRFPDGDAHAAAWVADRQAPPGSPDLAFFLLAWCQHFPVPDQAEAIHQSLGDRLFGPGAGEPERALVLGLVRLLARLEEAAGGRLPLCRSLLNRAARAYAGARKAGLPAARKAGLPAVQRFHRIGELVGEGCLCALLKAGGLPAEELDLVLREFPDLLRLTPGGDWPSANQAVARCLQRLAAGDADPQAVRVALAQREFAGMDAFLPACAALAPGGGEKSPEWAVHVLGHLLPPAEADIRRAGELAGLSQDKLLTAVLLAADWADLAEPHLEWPGLGALSRWVRDAGAEGEGGGPADREGALAVVEQMGHERLALLTAHPAMRSARRIGLYYLQAILGQNAEQVWYGYERKYLMAVAAVGLLPDRGDVASRYLKLARLFRESRRLREAADVGLRNLAGVAGHPSLSDLEWALEPELAESAGADRTWQIGPYVVRMEASEEARPLIQGKRKGKVLSTLPFEVRHAPEFKAFRDARTQVQAMWERVRHRLERAMVTGEVVERDRFLATMDTAPGRAYAPALLVRAWAHGEAEPIELLGFRTLDGAALDAAGYERFQVVHPLDLRVAGTLEAWQQRLVKLGLTQPFPQLLRELYTRAPAEGAVIDRLAGRTVRTEVMAERLSRWGWRWRGESCLVRSLPERGTAMLQLTPAGAEGIVTTGALRLPPGLEAIPFSEVLREVDLAALAASPDAAAQPAEGAPVPG